MKLLLNIYGFYCLLPQEPHLPSIDYLNNYKFYSALTDNGICEVYNGDTFNSVFKIGPTSKGLENKFDLRAKADPVRIRTGKMAAKTFFFKLL